MAGVIRGQVCSCALDPVVGTVQGGTRPVVVVQSDRLNLTSPHTIIVPFTTKIRHALLPSHVLVPAGAGGLIYDSVALCEHIRVVDVSQIVKVLGALDTQYLDDIANAIRRTLDL